jgi:glycosyltransferase involved in cell wall biosynthesis
LKLRDRVVLTGRVSERDKHALYQHATMAANPSLSEGFGLPILEAMSHGVPVIASNRTSHPEVAGDAALLVEPTADALADAMVRLAGNDALRTVLSNKGRARAREFSWSRTAEATIETYRRALALEPLI